MERIPSAPNQPQLLPVVEGKYLAGMMTMMMMMMMVVVVVLPIELGLMSGSSVSSLFQALSLILRESSERKGGGC